MTSNIISDHVLELLEPLTDELKVKPKENLSDRGLYLFWRYQGHYPNDFARALRQALPDHLEFVSYDHLTNKLEVQSK
jgi:hypothetical protein